MIRSALPIVLIVGRANVGKSTLFNRLSVAIKSITFDQPGVTRDPIHDAVSWQNKDFELVDTGGIELNKAGDYISKEAQKRAIELFEQADVIIFMVDGKAGLLPQDHLLAKQLYALRKPTIVAINKIDNENITEVDHELYALSFTKTCLISAQHGKGIDILLEAIVDLLPTTTKKVAITAPKYKVALIGKPNVGKSSLMNLLVGQERSIVADIPGTTREPIKETITFYQEDIQLIDTPGVRKKRSVSEGLEEVMVKTSMRSIKNADIILLLIDLTEKRISDQELKLAFYVFEIQHKALVLLLNKTDIAQTHDRETMEDSLDLYQHLQGKISTLTISCKTGKNVGKIIPLIDEIGNRLNQELPPDQLVSTIKDALRKRPLYKQTKKLEVKHVRQIKNNPMTLLFIVTEPALFDTTHTNYFDAVLRKKFDLKNVPIKYIIRGK
jgi:GTPase